MSMTRSAGRWPNPLRAGQPAGPNLVAYVVNQNSDDVAAIDVTAGAVIGRAAAGRNPHEIVVSPDGTRLFTSNQQGNTISIFDSASLQSLATWAGGAAP